MNTSLKAQGLNKIYWLFLEQSYFIILFQHVVSSRNNSGLLKIYIIIQK